MTQELMTLKQASKKTGIGLNKLYYDRFNEQKMKEHGMKLVIIDGRYFVKMAK